MKAAVKKFVEKTSTSALFWLYPLWGKPASFLGKIYEFARRRRENIRRTKQCVDFFFPDLTVKHGSFQGMRYLDRASMGSSFLPKLLGSYEAELGPVMETILRKNFTDIVDIGSAEGYYAVGLGLRFPEARIYAFDADPEARELCLEMARLNGLGQRLSMGTFCDGKTLQSLPFRGRALIISDCEGYEKELFTPEVVSFLAPHEVLIEVHDTFSCDIGLALREQFGPSHDIVTVESIDDLKKVRTCRYPELASCDARTKFLILAEWRGSTMEWLYLTPKEKARV